MATSESIRTHLQHTAEACIALGDTLATIPSLNQKVDHMESHIVSTVQELINGVMARIQRLSDDITIGIDSRDVVLKREFVTYTTDMMLEVYAM